MQVIYITKSTYRCLSNEFIMDFEMDNIIFHSAEQAFYYKLFENFPEIRDCILKTRTPQEAKRMGSLYNFCRVYGGSEKSFIYIKSQWYYIMKRYRDVQIDTMMKVLQAKFKEPFLQRQLLMTGDAALRLQRNKSALPHGSSDKSFSWMWWRTKTGEIKDGGLGDSLRVVRTYIRNINT